MSQAGEGGVGDGCFTSGQADLLPQSVWSCTGDDLDVYGDAVDDTADELADEASAAVGKPIVECHYDNEAKCVVHPNCEWCSTSDKVRRQLLHCFAVQARWRRQAFVWFD